MQRLLKVIPWSLLGLAIVNTETIISLYFVLDNSKAQEMSTISWVDLILTFVFLSFLVYKYFELRDRYELLAEIIRQSNVEAWTRGHTFRDEEVRNKHLSHIIEEQKAYVLSNMGDKLGSRSGKEVKELVNKFYRGYYKDE